MTPTETTRSGAGAGTIVTPEAVALDFVLAGIGTRSIASGIDALVQIALIAAAAVVAAFATGGSDVIAVVIIVVGVFAAVFLYPMAMETRNDGRTLGKMALGIRCVTAEGAPIRFRHAAIRALIGIIDRFATLGGVAVLSALATKRAQRVGDLAAATMVIRERSAAPESVPLRLVVLESPEGWQFAQTIDAATVNPSTVAVLRDWSSRRKDLSPEASAALEHRLVSYVAWQLQLRQPPGVTDVEFLNAVLNSVQRAESAARPTPPPPRAQPTPSNDYVWHDAPTAPGETAAQSMPSAPPPPSPPSNDYVWHDAPEIPTTHDDGFSAPG